MRRYGSALSERKRLLGASMAVAWVQLVLVAAFGGSLWVVKIDFILAALLLLLARLGVVPWKLATAFLCVLFSNLGEPACGILPSAWAFIVPCLCLVRDLRRARSGFLYGWWIGTLTAMGIFSWMWSALRTFLELSIPVTAVLFVVAGLLWGLHFAFFVSISRFLANRFPRVPLGILAPCVYAVCEFWAPIPCPISPSLSFVWTPVFLQIADLGGMFIVMFFAALLNGVLFEILQAFRAGERTRSFRWIAAGALLLTFQIGYGIRGLRIYAPDPAEPLLDTALIQPVAPLKILNSDQATKQDVAERLVRLSRQAVEEGPGEPNLLVWPEGAAPFSYRSPNFNPEYRAELRKFQNDFRVPLVVQDIEFVRRSESDRIRYYSTTSLIDGTGTLAGSYRKNFLVPFTEFLPGEEGFPFLRKIFHQSRSILKGEETVLLPGPQGPFAALICYEILFADYVRLFCAGGARYIINQTNDLWFGTEQQPLQHLAYAVYRAVENRVPVIRCTNSGISALIDPRGVIPPGYQTGAMEETVLRGTIQPRLAGSFYAAYGDLVPRWVLTPALLLALCYACFRRATPKENLEVF